MERAQTARAAWGGFAYDVYLGCEGNPPKCSPKIGSGEVESKGDLISQEECRNSHNIWGRHMRMLPSSSLAEVLAGDAALGGVVDDDGADGGAARAEGHAQVQLQRQHVRRGDALRDRQLRLKGHHSGTLLSCP